MQFPTCISIRRISSALISYSIPTHFHPSRRKMSNLPDSNYFTTKHRKLLKSYRYRLADFTVNEHKLERIMTMGPDFACMEWLMNAGATSVKLSDGTTIGSQKEMRKFLAAQGFNVKQLITKPPHVQILKHFEEQNNLRSLIIDENEYNKRWPHISPIHLKEVDASDAAITGNGCKYFLECRNIEKIKFNHNEFLMDSGLDELSKGRPARTLKELEICYNPYLTDSCATFLCRLTGLQRLHMYVLPGIGKRDAVRRKVNRALLKCKITFPKAYLIGYGYETEEQIEAYRRYYREEASILVRWLNDESEKFLGKRWENLDK